MARPRPIREDCVTGSAEQDPEHATRHAQDRRLDQELRVACV